MLERRRMRVTGTVQGVGFRPFVYRAAVSSGLRGFVRNDSEGVLIEVEGEPDALDGLGRLLTDAPPPLAHVHSVTITNLEPSQGGTHGYQGFQIDTSHSRGTPAAPVGVDAATCADCLTELFDPSDRRYQYPFTNCTNCGPRYTIVKGVPYDRASTTMSSFDMCDDCRHEYEDPSDRRFHAQPNACPVCGPHLRFLSPDGAELAAGSDAMDLAVHHLHRGAVVAVKGLGGYHLAVDATDELAVGRLRHRKSRDDKPFALMVPDLDAAERLCELSKEAAALLVSWRRPIVLARRRGTPTNAGAAVAGTVAPGLPELGLMLAYTPLHHLLLARMGRPLVMTSGNVSDDPISYLDREAVDRLGPMVDGFLTHNRPIHIRCDDSVVRSKPGALQVVRRSRGYAPEPLKLPGTARRQVLAVGAHLKSTVAVAKGQTVVASHHLGDLGHLAAYQSFLEATVHMCDLFGISPEVVAHDMHPEYISTKHAEEMDLECRPVQHHHAHVASCLVEHGRTDRVLGLAFDGLGYGDDGTLWGGEALLADISGYERAGHLRPCVLPGGEAAIREPWRMALAWTATCFGLDEAAQLGARLDPRWRAVLSLVESQAGPRTTSVGRLFDAVAAILGVRSEISYEGQAAIELEAIATRSHPGVASLSAPLVSRRAEGWVLDPEPLLADVIGACHSGVERAEVAAGFHAGLAAGAVELARRAGEEHHIGTVVLTGGVFQNTLFSDLVDVGLREAGMEVLTHHLVPPGDGGISIGQAAIASLSP